MNFPGRLFVLLSPAFVACQSAGPLVSTEGPFEVHAESVRTRGVDTRLSTLEVQIRNNLRSGEELCEIRLAREGKWSDNLLLSDCIASGELSVVLAPGGGRWQLRAATSSGVAQFIDLELADPITTIELR